MPMESARFRLNMHFFVGKYQVPLGNKMRGTVSPSILKMRDFDARIR